jgi:ElaB/YqjD/DUF883 family membrane-anchored ribosome-binding protein
MTRANAYPEIKDIKRDLGALKADAMELGRHIKADSSEKLQEFKANMKDMGQNNLDRVEEYIEAKPLQSLMIAFAAGLATSILLGLRR